uniref:Protein lingerer n=1 Tax=Rhabditophanes sp. KR3021 TaxID=114890 RepID=A0AC35U103_9BILA
MGTKSEYSDKKTVAKGTQPRKEAGFSSTSKVIPKPNLQKLIKKVVEAAGCSEERAEAALNEHNLSLEDAILEIVEENGQESWVEKKSKKTKKQEVAEELEQSKYDRYNKEKFQQTTRGGSSGRRGGRGGSSFNDRQPREDNSEWVEAGNGGAAFETSTFNGNAEDSSLPPTSASQTGSSFRGGRGGRGRGSYRGGRGDRQNGGRGGYSRNYGKDSDSGQVLEENEELNWNSGPLVFNKREEISPDNDSSVFVAPLDNKKVSGSVGGGDSLSYSSILRPKQTSTPSQGSLATVKTSTTVPSTASQLQQSTPTTTPSAYNPPNKAGPLSFAAAAAKAKPVPVVPAATMVKSSTSDHSKTSGDTFSAEFTEKNMISTAALQTEVSHHVKVPLEKDVAQEKVSSPRVCSSPKTVPTESPVIPQAQSWTNQLKKELGIHSLQGTKTTQKQQMEYDQSGNMYESQQYDNYSNESPKTGGGDSMANRRSVQPEPSSRPLPPSSDNEQQKSSSVQQQNTYSSGNNAVHQLQQQQRIQRTAAALSYADTTTMSFPPNERTMPVAGAQAKPAYGQQQAPSNVSQQQGQQQQPQQHQMYNPAAQQQYNPYSQVPYFNMNMYSPVTSMRTDDAASQYAANMLQFPYNMTPIDFGSLASILPPHLGGPPANQGQSGHSQSGMGTQQNISHQRQHDQDLGGYNFKPFSNGNNPSTTPATSVNNNASGGRGQEASSVAPPPGFNNTAASNKMSSAYYQQQQYPNMFSFPPGFNNGAPMMPFNVNYQAAPTNQGHASGHSNTSSHQKIPNQQMFGGQGGVHHATDKQSNDIRLLQQQQQQSKGYGGHQGGSNWYANEQDKY